MAVLPGYMKILLNYHITNRQMFTHILLNYGIPAEECRITTFGTGLINHTWKIVHPHGEYILQKINENVFSNPIDIVSNIDHIGSHLRHKKDYLFVNPIKTINGKSYITGKDGFFRLMPFVSNSLSFDIVETPSIAYEAAQQFGLFTRLLCDIDISKLKITLPDFHNLPLRYEHFNQALKNGNPQRISTAEKEIDFIRENENIVSQYQKIKENADFKIRATHHDTKISNVLFDKQGKGICVIDLDTTMPGYFISDVGDMMRTYLSPVSEEEIDLSKIYIRDEYFTAISKGYLHYMQDELTDIEKEHFVYAGSCMIYMQGLRFLTDYINNDIYYGANSEHHNLNRARNQIKLLQAFHAKKGSLEKVIARLMKHPIIR